MKYTVGARKIISSIYSLILVSIFFNTDITNSIIASFIAIIVIILLTFVDYYNRELGTILPKEINIFTRYIYPVLLVLVSIYVSDIANVGNLNGLMWAGIRLAIILVSGVGIKILSSFIYKLAAKSLTTSIVNQDKEDSN